MRKIIRTKVDLPGYVAGTIIEKRSGLYYVKNEIFTIPVPETIIKNNLFYEELSDKFCLNYGDKITIKKQFLYKYNLPQNEFSILTFVEYMSNNFYFLKANFNGKKIQVDIRHIKLAETYYFIDSKGKIQIATIGKDVSADNYRKNISNYFDSKDEAYQHQIKVVKCD